MLGRIAHIVLETIGRIRCCDKHAMSSLKRSVRQIGVTDGVAEGSTADKVLLGPLSFLSLHMMQEDLIAWDDWMWWTVNGCTDKTNFGFLYLRIMQRKVENRRQVSL